MARIIAVSFAAGLVAAASPLVLGAEPGHIVPGAEPVALVRVAANDSLKATTKPKATENENTKKKSLKPRPTTAPEVQNDDHRADPDELWDTEFFVSNKRMSPINRNVEFVGR